jgi:microcin C transport system ATP-binding protein
VQAQILELLRELKTEHGMAMLFITHDLGIVRKFADRVCVMTDGKIVETGPTAEIFANPQHAYTKHLLAAEPKGEPPRRKPSAPEVMQARDIKVWFPVKQGFLRRTVDHVKAVDGLSTDPEIRPDAWRRRRIRIGQDDAGAGADAADPQRRRDPFQQASRCTSGRSSRCGRSEAMQVVFQDPFGSLSPRMSIADIVGEGLAIHARDLSREERDRRVAGGARGSRARRLDALALSARVFRRPAPAHRDCPGHGAQAPFRDAGRADLGARHERSGAGGRSAARSAARRHDLAYLFISHDLKVVRALANDVIVMRAGKVVEQGTADQIFDHPTTEYTKALMAAAFNLEAASGGARQRIGGTMSDTKKGRILLALTGWARRMDPGAGQGCAGPAGDA